jgi:hypothetical protein
MELEFVLFALSLKVQNYPFGSYTIWVWDPILNHHSETNMEGNKNFD